MTHTNPLRFCQVLIPPYHTLLFNQNCFRKSKLLIMDKSNPSAGQFPSAPPLEHPTPPTLETVTPLQGANYGQPPQDQPPPSYQESINYPPAPPYPTYDPNNFPAMPVPPGSSVSHHHPQPGHSPHPNYATAHTPSIYVTPTQQPATTTHHIHHTTVAPIRRNPCAFCLGSVESETDVCCLLCLILLAIFTFPFGLILLFCIPCSVRKRCNVCRRLYD